VRTPPGLGEVALGALPDVVVPDLHQLVEAAPVETGGIAAGLLDEVAEEFGAGREAVMVHITVQRLVHAVNELAHGLVP
jgi:hypothetical protein